LSGPDCGAGGSPALPGQFRLTAFASGSVPCPCPYPCPMAAAPSSGSKQQPATSHQQTAISKQRSAPANSDSDQQSAPHPCCPGRHPGSTKHWFQVHSPTEFPRVLLGRESNQGQRRGHRPHQDPEPEPDPNPNRKPVREGERERLTVVPGSVGASDAPPRFVRRIAHTTIGRGLGRRDRFRAMIAADGLESHDLRPIHGDPRVPRVAASP
jgi:hypothetical protein